MARESVLDVRELNDLASFASRGGLGMGIALTDCVAEQPDQLMYLKGDELVLLRDLGKLLLASCEGVVGWVEKEHVKFDSIASGSSPIIPQTILTAPSPETSPARLPDSTARLRVVEPPLDANRPVSGPFELDESPISTPSIENSDRKFFEDDPVVVSPKKSGMMVEDQGNKRESVTSIASSAFGGIGGFMMDQIPPEKDSPENIMRALQDDMEQLQDIPATLPPSRSTSMPNIINGGPISPDRATTDRVSYLSRSSISRNSNRSSEDWDIYDDYARESMYYPPARSRMSSANKRSSRAKSKVPGGDRNSYGWDSDGENRAFEAARAALEKVAAKRELRDQQRNLEERKLASPISARSSIRKDEEDHSIDSIGSPAPPRPARRRPLAMDLANGVPALKEIDTDAGSPTEIKTPMRLEIRNPETPVLQDVDSRPAATPSPIARIASPLETGPRARALEILNPTYQRESDSDPASPIKSPQSLPERKASIHSSENTHNRNLQSPLRTHTPTPPVSADFHSSPKSISHQSHSPARSSEGSTPRSSVGLHESEVSTEIQTPNPPHEMVFTPSSPVVETFPQVVSASSSSNSLLASPGPPSEVISPKTPLLGGNPDAFSTPTVHLGPPRRNLSPNLPGPLSPAWSPNSPSSPHSIAATRQAVEAVKTTPEGKRPRGLTLVGRMEADLSAAKGPVPITFLLGGPGASLLPPPLPSSPIGLGTPPNTRRSPEPRRATSPLPLDPPFSDPMHELKNAPSPFPQMPQRSFTNPMSPNPPTTAPTHKGPKAGFFPSARPRSRSFSAAVSKAMGKASKKDTPNLAINTNVPPIPDFVSPIPAYPPGRNLVVKNPNPNSPSTSPGTVTAPARPVQISPVKPKTMTSPSKGVASSSKMTQSSSMQSILGNERPSYHSNASTASLPHPPPSARSTSFSFTSSKGPRTPKSSKPLPSPVSHKDYEDTIQANGMDFELIQPTKKSSLLAPLSPSHTIRLQDEDEDPSNPGGKPSLARKNTTKSNLSGLSGLSGNSLGHLAETDEWGFLKDQSPTPEIFQSRAAPGEHRLAEQKWLTLIASPLPSNGNVPKKVKKLVLESGIPGSLRGKVWAWFMAPGMSAKTPGIYHELLDHDKGYADERIDRDVDLAFADHSLFADRASSGQADLRNILRAYSNFAPSGYRTEMSLLAGMLLIHCVAEDAFWLLSGLINGCLKNYYSKIGNVMKVDAAVFAGVLQGSEPKVAKLLRDVGVHPMDFLETWYTQMFLRCLPWPTALRVIDAIIAEGPRFLLVASLSIITLSRERLLSLPKSRKDILGYLRDLPQDSLLLPETFMKNCENVKFKDEDLKKMRAAVEKDVKQLM